MSENIKQALQIYKRATFKVFTPLGLAFSIILVVITAGLTLININTFDITIDDNTYELVKFSPLTLIFGIIAAFYATSIWWILGTRGAPKVGELLTENKILSIVFTKGDMHYFEKTKPEELKIVPGMIIAKLINLLITWLAIVAFLIGLILPLLDFLLVDPIISDFNSRDQARLLTFFSSNFDHYLPMYLMKILFVLFISPLLLTIVIPVPWMLIDTKLKSYKSGPKLNNLVGRQLQARLNGIFAVGGLVTLFLAAQSFLIEFLIVIISFVIFFLFLPCALIVLLYNMLFQVQYYESFLRQIPVPFGITKVEMETKFPRKTSDQEKDPNQGSEINSDDKGLDESNSDNNSISNNNLEDES